MSEPLVCAVCLTKDRPAMLQRAIRCFRSQTYESKRMYILDSGIKPAVEALPVSFPDYGIVFHRTSPFSRTIGALRNYADMWSVKDGCEILMHFDDDDWSAPTRMAEQVAALQSGEYDATGYSDMLFWDETLGESYDEDSSGQRYAIPVDGEAWLYTAPRQKRDSVLGTSLAYWRETWERKPFKDTSRGEDFHFYSGLRVKQVSSLTIDAQSLPTIGLASPRMVASIHDGNECSQIIPGHEQWRRVPDWDVRLREIMQL